LNAAVSVPPVSTVGWGYVPGGASGLCGKKRKGLHVSWDFRTPAGRAGKFRDDRLLHLDQMTGLELQVKVFAVGPGGEGDSGTTLFWGGGQKKNWTSGAGKTQQPLFSPRLCRQYLKENLQRGKRLKKRKEEGI